MQTTRYKSFQTLNLKREISQNKRKNQITKQECQKAKLQSFSLFPLQPCNIFAQTPIHRISRLLRNLISGSSIACQISSSLRTDHDVPPKDSIVTPKQESNIKDAAVARTNNSVLRFSPGAILRGLGSHSNALKKENDAPWHRRYWQRSKTERDFHPRTCTT